ncbi:MoaD/ThiS family protein [Carboxydochorda subterranea]|uniref:MoaD/ThiS family protein n=1 Tax=Carboxydichorda subterranea TaxID=3109565 RepID=A0ABZ1C1I6_9FIRM|nr:MoaD/ThiS family protein [Limnochorda sp. L945t]WRP18970.1 MoaD/ThiS family protein [Limnochorda sp. L945t]
MLIRIPKRQEHVMRGPRTVQSILEELRINPETVIVIRGQSLLTRDSVVEDADEIEVRPALSGGR